MARYSTLAAGVLIWFCCGQSALAEPSRSTLEPPWSTRTWYTHPTDFCRFGNNDICALPSGDKGSEPAIHSTSEPIRVGPKPKSTPPLSGRYPSKTAFLTLSAAVYAAAWIDMHRTYTLSKLPGSFKEADPFVRPLLKLPEPAYYATGFALATGVNYLGWRMSRSRRFHRIWFIPQALTLAGNIYGRASTVQVIRP